MSFREDRAARALTEAAVVGDIDAFEKGDDLTQRPLWTERNPVAVLWQSVLPLWSAETSPMRFWARWYSPLLAPETAPSISLATREAVSVIADEVWAAGPAAVAEEIARIEARA